LLANDEAEASEILDEELSTRERAAVFDEILAPTLIRAGRDHVRGNISAEEEDFIVRTIRDTVSNNLEALDRLERPADTPPQRRVLGVPARNNSDEVGLIMLSQLVGSNWTMERLTTATLASELLDAIVRIEPDVLCISSFPPAGLTQARYLCKRVHTQFPLLPIWILRPDVGVSADTIAEQFAVDGAQQVATSFTVAATQLSRFVCKSVALDTSLRPSGTGPA